MAVEGVMVTYNYSEDGEYANILTVSASGIRFSKRWVLTHGSILSPLKEAKIIKKAKGKPILSDEFYANLPEMHVTCEKKQSINPNLYESVEKLSRERNSQHSDLDHNSYLIRVLTGRYGDLQRSGDFNLKKIVVLLYTIFVDLKKNFNFMFQYP